MSNLHFTVVQNPDEARKLWEAFSPHETIDDEWDFRDLWTKELELPFYFITGYDGTEAVGLLPLQLNTHKGLGPKLLQREDHYLEFFGGVDTDNNRVLLKPGYEHCVPDFLHQINQAAVLTDLAEAYCFNGQQAVRQTDKYELDLTGITSFDAYLDRYFQGKNKGKLKNKIRYMYKTNDITIKNGDESELELLFAFSKEKHGENSSFHMEYRQRVYRNLLQRYKADLITILVGGKTKAVAYCIPYKNTYLLLNVGYDHELRDIGKLLVQAQIERAIQLGCIVYDAGKGDNGWKERFHFSKRPQYKLVLN